MKAPLRAPRRRPQGRPRGVLPAVARPAGKKHHLVFGFLFAGARCGAPERLSYCGWAGLWGFFRVETPVPLVSLNPVLSTGAFLYSVCCRRTRLFLTRRWGWGSCLVLPFGTWNLALFLPLSAPAAGGCFQCKFLVDF